MKLLGTIRALYRYPVKSMAGEARRAATLGWHGLDGDRRFAFRRLGDASDFPWLTASKLPALVCYRPYVPAGETLVRVVTPEGQDLAADSAELREQVAAACGNPVELMHLKHGTYDEAPLSVISLATMRRVHDVSGVPIDVRRFRPNVVVETPDDQPFAEDAWVGLGIRCGEQPESAMFAATLRDLRCVMLNLDPDTGRADPRLLKATAQLNSVCAGVYAVPLRRGTLRVGDELFAPLQSIESHPPKRKGSPAATDDPSPTT
jgi:uncharacterized protein YcbX